MLTTVWPAPGVFVAVSSSPAMASRQRSARKITRNPVTDLGPKFLKSPCSKVPSKWTHQLELCHLIKSDLLFLYSSKCPSKVPQVTRRFPPVPGALPKRVTEKRSSRATLDGKKSAHTALAVKACLLGCK